MKTNVHAFCFSFHSVEGKLPANREVGANWRTGWWCHHTVAVKVSLSSALQRTLFVLFHLHFINERWLIMSHWRDCLKKSDPSISFCWLSINRKNPDMNFGGTKFPVVHSAACGPQSSTLCDDHLKMHVGPFQYWIQSTIFVFSCTQVSQVPPSDSQTVPPPEPFIPPLTSLLWARVWARVTLITQARPSLFFALCNCFVLKCVPFSYVCAHFFWLLFIPAVC